MPEEDPPPITIRRSTLIRAGVVVLVLAALGGGIAIGLSASSPTSHRARTLIVRSNVTTTTAALPPTTTIPPNTTTTAPLPTVTLGGTWTGMEPSTIAFSADGGNIVTGITWSSWNYVNAVGQGTWTYQNCVPDCLHGAEVPYPAMITMADPVGGQFTVLTEETSMMGTATYKLPAGYGDLPSGT
jgi:hypothetical protein